MNGWRWLLARLALTDKKKKNWDSTFDDLPFALAPVRDKRRRTVDAWQRGKPASIRFPHSKSFLFYTRNQISSFFLSLFVCITDYPPVFFINPFSADPFLLAPFRVSSMMFIFLFYLFWSLMTRSSLFLSVTNSFFKIQFIIPHFDFSLQSFDFSCPSFLSSLLHALIPLHPSFHRLLLHF